MVDELLVCLQLFCHLSIYYLCCTIRSEYSLNSLLSSLISYYLFSLLRRLGPPCNAFPAMTSARKIVVWLIEDPDNDSATLPEQSKADHATWKQDFTPKLSSVYESS